MHGNLQAPPCRGERNAATFDEPAHSIPMQAATGHRGMAANYYTPGPPRLYHGDMDATVQVALSVGVPTLAVLVGILINNSRLSDLRAYMDSRFNSIEKLFDEKLNRVEGVIDARLTRIEHELKLR
jgi:hypothetical protein